MSRTFNGTTDKIISSQSASLTTLLPAFTATQWIFYPTSPQEGGLFDIFTGGFALFIACYINQASNANFFGMQGGPFGGQSFSTAQTLTPNIWQHIAVTYNDSTDRTFRLYLNGVEVSYMSKASNTGSLFVNTGLSTVIGSDGGVTFFKGSIAEAQFYNTILSPSQIMMTMNGGSPAPKNLQAYLPLRGLLSPEPDVSGNNNSGILTGTTTGAAIPGITYGYNVPDCRNSTNLPNQPVFNQGTLLYIRQTAESRVSGVPVDSRLSVPSDCRVSPNYPLNSRTSGTFGPGE